MQRSLSHVPARFLRNEIGLHVSINPTFLRIPVLILLLISTRVIAETFTVPANGTPVYSAFLEQNVRYLIKSEGIYCYNTGANRWADAEWSGTLGNNWVENAGDNPDWGGLDLWINNAPPDWVGSTDGATFAEHTFSPSSIYYLTVTGQNQPLVFRIVDTPGYYSDNSGSLTVTISRLPGVNIFSMPPGETSLQFVTVGDPGNLNDPLTGYGSVSYSYQIGKFEVTIGQYVQFLNAVAATDTYGLYNSSTASNPNIAGILRSGSPGSYRYAVIGSPNWPITYVKWADAARFTNWLTNGQPTGAQDMSTTEDGSYFLNGANTVEAIQAVTRKPNAIFMIPTENEWYKAAYYDPTQGGSHYWLYPERTDIVPYSIAPPGTGAPNPAYTANFSFAPGNLTDVGAYTLASSFYGTADQGGNVWEWNETIIASSYRCVRGGGWGSNEIALRASNRGHGDLFYEGSYIEFGFRVATTVGTSFIILSPTVINRTVFLGDNLPNDSFNVSNSGTNTINYSISDGGTLWIDESPTNGSSNSEIDPISIIYSVSGLSFGPHSALITVSAPEASNSPQTVQVNVNVVSVRPDFDGDGDVDSSDFGHLQECFSGTSIPPRPGCANADLDVTPDNDVDAQDLTVFLNCISGSNVMAIRTCDD